MQNFSKITQLNRATLLFPLALVLFEFAVYIANDMTQPAMLLVTQEFGVGNAWVAISMTAFTFGGAALSLFIGPLSDRLGRRPVMVGGVLYFIFTCLAVYWVHNIQAFMLLRVLQGVGLCFIGAVGYAAIQESFEEKSAVKVTALMANVSLLAPMVGPLAGATLVEFSPWRSSFLLIAIIACIALSGLWRTMPETVDTATKKTPFSTVIHEYLALSKQTHFVLSALCIPAICIPLVAWIALSPVLLIHDLGLSMLEYGLWQLPVFGSLIAGNIWVIHLADRWPLGRSVLICLWPILLGAFLSLTGLLFPFNTPLFIVAGVSLISFSVGLAFSVLYRFTLMSSDLPKGTVSAGMATIILGAQALGIEIVRTAYITGGITGFTFSMVLFSGAFILLSRPRIQREMALRARNLATN